MPNRKSCGLKPLAKRILDFGLAKGKSFERVYDDQTDKNRSHSRAGEAATSAGEAEGGASAIIRCRRDHVETDADRYARVSTVDQNLALQRDALTEAGCAKIFTEQMSGAVTDRPALHDALEFARSGDTLIVWKLDRLARSMKQLIETVETLRVRGIGFRSLTEALDTTTAQGRLVFHMFGALAEFERSLIRERTQAGLAAARRAGRTGGRPRKLTDDDIEAAKAVLANPDIGVTQIARRLGVSPATLYRYIPAARTANTPGV
jgi:DNA invertase Pin-like site-specific DNA recombinase